MNIIIIRTLILFGVIIIFLRLMGKRQIGQLQPYELVVIIMISELGAIPMQDTGIPLVNGLIPIFVLFTAQVALSFLSLKSERARGIICGKPSIIIEKAKIKEKEMRKLRYNINDLLEQLRSKGVTDISDVEFAVLETNGEISVFLKSQKRAVQPADLGIDTPYEGLSTSLIMDGHVIQENLENLNLTVEYLQNELNKYGITDLKDVFFASLDTQGQIFYQVKSSSKN
ncbi:MAG TPA: DUF421 domain-containing protein [Syntrophomonadaceae bacterium]|nr:DUF421 domain-containing protein [Syntrophomonadaceae bacterium]